MQNPHNLHPSSENNPSAHVNTGGTESMITAGVVGAGATPPPPTTAHVMLHGTSGQFDAHANGLESDHHSHHPHPYHQHHPLVHQQQQSPHQHVYSDDHHHRDSGSNSGGPKRKRVVLSIHEKQQVLQRLELGEQPVVIARDFGISRQQVSDIKKNKDRILSFCVDAKHLSSLRRKTLKATSEYHPGVEQELYRWLIRQRKLTRVVTSETLTNRATDLFMQYSADDSTVSFKTVTNWLRHFKRAHGIKTLTEEELERLPEKFTPAMDMSRAFASAASSATATSSAGSTANGGGTFTEQLVAANATHVHSSSSMVPPQVDDVSAYIAGMNSSNPHLAHLQQQQSHTSPSRGPHHQLRHGLQSPSSSSSASELRNPLHVTVDIIHELNAQLESFEREMTNKLDFLDARVEKLCFTALPPRLA